MARAPPTDRMEDIGTAPDDEETSDGENTSDDGGGGRPPPDERMEDIGTAPEPDPEPEPDPTDQPARGRDRDSGSGSGSGGTGDVNETEPNPEPEPDQPARGGDRDSGDGRGSGGTGDVGESEPEDDPTDQPARGADPESGSGRGSGDPEPDPEPDPDPSQPARGRDETRTGDESVRENLERQEEEVTVSPEEFEETRTINVSEATEGELATGQGLEANMQQAREFERQVAQEQGLDPEDIAIRRDGDTLRAVPTEAYATEQLVSQLEGRERVESVTADDGEIQATLEPTREDIAEQLEQEPGAEQVFVRGSEEQGDVTAVVGLTEEEIERAEVAASMEMDRQVAEGARDVTEARREVQRERTREEFGDVAVTIPESVTIGQEYRGPTGEAAPPGARGGRMGEREVQVPAGGERVENVLAAASEDFQQGAEALGTGVSGGLGDLLAQPLQGEQPDVGRALETARADQSAGAEAFGDVVTGGAAIADVPGVALTAKEAAEFGSYSVGEVAEGEFNTLQEETAAAAQERVSAVTEFAQENPAEFAGITAGSLVGSTAIMGSAARVSSRAGRVSRYAIQPGEELLTETGTRALGTTATGQRALDAIPGGRLDWEEPLVAGGQRLLRETQDVSSDLARRIRLEATAARFKAAELRNRGGDARLGVETELGDRGGTLDDFLGDERGMAQLGMQRARQPELETETESEVRQEAERQRQRQRERAETAQQSELETEYARTQTELANIETGQDFEITPDVAAEAGVETAEASLTELGIESRIDTRQELFTETETALDTEVETAVDTQTETAVESMAELRQEVEAIAETEGRTEQEAAAESRVPEDPEPEEGPSPLDVDVFEERFGTGIADVEDLLGDG